MSSTTYKYQQVLLTFSNVQPGTGAITVTLAPMTGTKDMVEWSTGQPMSNSYGISLLGGSDAVPVTQFTVSPNLVTVITSSSGGGGGSALQFSVKAYLIANETLSDFLLTVQGPANTGATVAVGQQTPQALNLGQTIKISWNPF